MGVPQVRWMVYVREHTFSQNGWCIFGVPPWRAGNPMKPEAARPRNLLSFSWSPPSLMSGSISTTSASPPRRCSAEDDAAGCMISYVMFWSVLFGYVLLCSVVFFYVMLYHVMLCMHVCTNANNAIQCNVCDVMGWDVQSCNVMSCHATSSNVCLCVCIQRARVRERKKKETEGNQKKREK